MVNKIEEIINRRIKGYYPIKKKKAYFNLRKKIAGTQGRFSLLKKKKINLTNKKLSKFYSFFRFKKKLIKFNSSFY